MKVGTPMVEVGSSNKESVEAMSSEDAAKLAPALSSFLGMGATAVLALAAARMLDTSDDLTIMGMITTQSSALAQLGSATELFLATRSLLDDMKQCFHSGPKSNNNEQRVLSESRVMDISMQAYTILVDTFFSPVAREVFEIELQHRALLEPVRKKYMPNAEFIEDFDLEPAFQRIQRITDPLIELFQADLNTDSEAKSWENVGEACDATLLENFQGLMKKAIAEIFSDDFSAEGWLRKRETDLLNNHLRIQTKLSAAAKATDSIEQREIFQIFIDETREIWDFSAPEVRRKIKTLLDVGSQLRRERLSQLHNEPSEPAFARGPSIG